MQKRSVLIYILITIITIIVFFHISSVLAKEKQDIIKPTTSRGATKFDQSGNSGKVTPIPVLIDPRNTDTVVNESLGVDIRLSKPDCPWIRYSLSATLWKWMVRKPGIYAAKCLTGTVKSNVDIVINFKGFEDLETYHSIGDFNWSDKCSDQELETYYSATLSNLTVAQVLWHRACEFNNPQYDLFIPQNPLTPTGWSLWNKILVTNDISACNFKDNAAISFEIANLDLWVDPEIPESGNNITK